MGKKKEKRRLDKERLEAAEKQKRAADKFQSAVESSEQAEREAVKKVYATRKLVLEGLDYREKVQVPEYPGVIFVLAPVTDGEYSRVRELTVSSIDFDKVDLKKLGGEGKDILKAVNIPKMIRSIDSAKYLALSFSLTRGMKEEWTPEDIGKLKLGVPDRLYEKLDKICGLTAEMQRKAEGFPGVSHPQSS